MGSESGDICSMFFIEVRKSWRRNCSRVVSAAGCFLKRYCVYGCRMNPSLLPFCVISKLGRGSPLNFYLLRPRTPPVDAPCFSRVLRHVADHTFLVVARDPIPQHQSISRRYGQSRAKWCPPHEKHMLRTPWGKHSASIDTDTHTRFWTKTIGNPGKQHGKQAWVDVGNGCCASAG